MRQRGRYDIGIAAKELLSRPEQKKMLVVLSDGQPTESLSSGDEDDNRHGPEEGIQVSGIYFEEGSIGRDAGTFRHMYGKENGICVTTKEIDEDLEKLFLQVFQILKKQGPGEIRGLLLSQKI